ncbi:MAG: MNIO family bufferin maturase [Gammaproteobacteria bacterium]
MPVNKEKRVAAMQLSDRNQAPIPASAGIGLRSRYFREIIEYRPDIAWFEVHSENYFGDGGPPLLYLERIRRDYPLSLHGVGLSLGSVDPIDQNHLRQLKALADRFEPGLVSEHMSWSSFNGVYLNDLIPLLYNRETLNHLTSRIERIQEFLGRQILIENPSSYLEFQDSTYRESEFLAELARRSGCGILLDVNNIYVSSRNHGWDALAYLREIPPVRVGEIHLSGHATNEVGGKTLLIDTHDRAVSSDVWDLFSQALRLVGPVPTLIEWDAALPDLSVLQNEAAKADLRLEEVRYERAS